MIIYKVENKKNGKVYIGKTKHTLIHRMKEHLRDSKNPKTTFHHALAKYGHDEFEWKVIYKCKDINELNTLEVKFISEYNSYKNGYNSTTGGDGGYEFSDDVLKKIGDCTKRRNILYGNPFQNKTHTDESKKVISKQVKEWYNENDHPFKGKTHVAETIQKIREANKEWHKYNENSFKGKTHTDEAKKLMRQKRIEWHNENENPFKGKVHSETTKKIISEKNTGNISPNKGKELSESHRNSLSEAQRKWLENNKHPFNGKTQTDEAKEKMKRAWEQRVEKKCPHCNKVGKANMKRYHFDNCKYKNE
jgi:group I intron endonuclease